MSKWNNRVVPVPQVGSQVIGQPSHISSMTVAGANIEFDADYPYGNWMEIRHSVTSWAGIGTSFMSLYMRTDVSADATGCNLRSMEIYTANQDGIDVANLQSFMFNVMAKGNSTITLMRGGEVKLEWLATDTITDARALQVEYMGLAAPTNPVYGIWFESDSAAGAMAAKFYEIRMKAGMVILSGTGAPAMTAPQGSLYLRTDGSGAGDRAYINTDGAGTWTNITTAA